MKRLSVHRLAVVAVWSTLFLVAFGGYTRGSGSGYGCKDRWPLCEGGLLGGYLPRLEAEMVIEWTHRWIALLVGILALALVVAAIRARMDRLRVVAPAIAAVVVIGFQAWLGRMVVKCHLDRDLVSIHMFVSMVVVALFVIVAVTSRDVPEKPALLDRAWTGKIAIGALFVLGVSVLGSIVHNMYFPGWPLVDGHLVPDLTSTHPLTIHWYHRVVAGSVFVYLVWLAWQAARAERPLSERRHVNAALILYMINMALGLLHVLTRVESSWVVASHLLIASMAWAALVAAASLSFHDPRHESGRDVAQAHSPRTGSGISRDSG